MSDLGNKEIMAKNIKRLMDRDRLNVKELSEKIKTPYSTVMDWTKAMTYPRIDKIEAMANFFKVEKSDLIEARPADFIDETPQRKYLLDKLSKASEADIEKFAQLWKLINEEEQKDW